MNHLQQIIICLVFMAASALCTMLLTRILIAILPKLGYMDIPHGRHEHDHAVPRGGGIAIVLGFAAVFFIYLALYGTITVSALEYLIPAGILFVLGLIDDRVELSGRLKLAVQILVGISVYFIGGGIDRLFHLILPVWIALPLTVLWCIAIINAFNLIDGLDGLAAGIAAAASFSIICWNLISGGNVIVTAALMIFCGCCLGFLRYNFSPAKIFMGDTGSMFLGLFFAVISMQQATKSVTIPALLVPLIAIGIPIFDVFLAVWRRFVRKLLNPAASGVMQGDHDHLHHRIQAQTGSQKKTTFLLYGVTLLITFAAIGITFFNSLGLSGLAFAAILCGAFLMIRLFAEIEIRDSLTLAINGLKVPRRSTLMLVFHPLIDLFLLIVSSAVSVYILEQYKSGIPVIYILTQILPAFIVLLVSGVYNTYWLRAGIKQYFRLFESLVIGAVIGGILLKMVIAAKYLPPSGALTMYYIFSVTAILLIIGERLLLRYVIGYWIHAFRQKDNERDGKKMDRIVIYGGGIYCDLYLREFFLSQKNLSAKVLGVIDDNPAFHNLNVCGFRVLGTGNDLEKVFKKHRFTKLVMTVRESETLPLETIRGFCRRENIELYRYETQLNQISAEQ